MPKAGPPAVQQTGIELVDGAGPWSNPFFWIADFQIAAVVDIRDQFESKPAPL
jgi:hypothetical protein